MDEKYENLSYKIAIFKSFFLFIRDETTDLEKIVLRVVHRKGEKGAEAAPVTSPKTASAQGSEQPLLCLQPTTSQLLQC